LLDRTAWLLARHSSLWLELSAETHDFLIGQPTPYSQFFAALERLLHEHGALGLPALLDELQGLQQDDRAPGDDDPGETNILRPLLQRMTRFHDVDDDEPPDVLIESILRRLRQQAVADELNLLLESGELSEQATARRNELIALTAELKNQANPPAKAGKR
jgi:DNA primase